MSISPALVFKEMKAFCEPVMGSMSLAQKATCLVIIISKAIKVLCWESLCFLRLGVG